MMVFKESIVNLYFDARVKNVEEARAWTEFVYVIFTPLKFFDLWQFVL